MAAVFLAHEIALNRKVAIKVMSPGVMLSDDMVERFRQEAVTVANLTHSNIVTVHAVREVDGLHFFVMEFVAGRALDKVLAKTPRLPIPVVRAILSQVGSALAYAHRRGVIHRDVKPGNIILDADGQAIVTDFGIAKVMTSPSQTQTGAVHGTAAYMSPEQCYASPLTPASDQYSLGVVAYEMLAGRPPFVAESSFALMQSHTSAAVPPLLPHRDDCPPALEAAVLRMMAKKPNERWPGITAALTALQAFPVAPEDPVLDELVRLADVEATRSVGDVLRTPVSPVPTVPKRTPARTPITAERTTAPSPPPVSVPPRVIRIEPTVVSMEVGDRTTLRATVLGGTPLSSLETIVWSSSSAELVRADPRTGLISAEAPGTAIITATVAGVESSVVVTIVPAAVAALKIAPANMSPVVGDRLQLSATATDKSGRRLDRTVSWSTSAPEVGSISSTGELTLHTAGTLDVFAACDSQRDELRLNVRRRPVARLEIVNAIGSITAGERLELTALPRDETGAALDGRTTTWTSNDRFIATVSDDGVVSAHQAGTVTLTARCEGKTASFRLTISAPPLGSVVLSAPEMELSVKGRVRLTAVVKDIRGDVVDAKLRWRSSDPRVMTVSDKGEATAVRPGKVVITARADDVEGRIELSVAAPVVAAPPPPVVDVRATPNVAAREDLAAIPVSQPTTRRRRLPPVWAMGVGLVAVLGVGVFMLSGDSKQKSDDPPGKQQTAVWTLALSQPPALVRVGDSFALSADVRGGDPASLSPTRWQSPTPSVLVDSMSGRVAALAPGHALVIASSGNAIDTVAFDVMPPLARGPDAVSIATIEIQLPPAGESAEIGDRIPLRAVAFDSTHKATPSGAVTWSSSDPAIARVDLRTGLVTALGVGRVRITARGDSRRAEATLVVRASPVRDVVISGLDQLESGQSAQMQAAVRDTRSNLVPDAAVSWTSDNRSIVQIDAATGRVRAGESGQAVVTATVGSVAATKTIVVTKKTEEVVVEKPKDPPPPPVTPTREELLRAGEARIRGAVENYARELGARNIERVRSVYLPVSEQDTRNLERLAALMKTNGLTVLRAVVGTPRLESGRAVVDLATTIKWKNFAGAQSEREVPFLAVFEWSGTEWRLVTCRIVGSPRLT
jgi:serine/threonine-protein kinase